MTLTIALHFLLILISIALLWKGADWFVDSSVRIARKLNVSDLVIGLTLVGLATSAPEFAVSIGAALKGHSNISVANVVGSNIFNIGFILGGCAAIRPIITSRHLVYRDGMVLLATTVLLTFFAWNLTFSRIEGLLLMFLLVVYLSYLFIKKESVEEHIGEEKAATWKDIAAILVGFSLIVGGGQLLVYSAVEVARVFGLPEWAIGVTVVAAGTSAPELVTSLNAAVKGRFGISAGNLIGSDIFNLLGVLGLAAFIRPLEIDAAGQSSMAILIVMVGVAVFFMRTGWRLSRWEGIILVVANLVRWYFDMMVK